MPTITLTGSLFLSCEDLFGKVILVGHITRCQDAEPCELSAARVAKVNLATFEVEQLVGYKGNKFFEMGTVVIDVDNDVLFYPGGYFTAIVS